MQDWMLLCQYNPQFCEEAGAEQECDWLLAAGAYPDLQEMPSFIAQQQQHFTIQSARSNACPDSLQGKQLQAYLAVQQHFQCNDGTPLRMIVSGTAGTGKSYLIQCLKLLLKDSLCVAAPTGVAAFNVDGHTLHSLFSLPVKGDFKPLEGKRLHTIQQTLASIKYLIIDEMSMVGRKLFGQVDRQLRQVFPEKAEELFGGCSCVLIGDWGQLPPVMDLPLYTTVSRSELSNLGSTDYHLFDRAVVLDQVMRQAGQNPDQEFFRDLLLRLRNAELTIEDWKHLMSRTPVEVGNISCFDRALHLYPTIEAVAEHNISKLYANGHPIAVLKAIHSGPGASKATSDDASGLEPIVWISHRARVMLSANLWVEVGLVNGALGTVEAICYERGQSPPSLPLAVTVKFDSYTGPTLQDGTVPITPLRRTWFSTTKQCSRKQVPLKLAWAITIHKSQGLTLDKVVIDIGKKEFSTGLTFVACSRVRQISDLLFVPPFTFQRVANLSKGNRLKERLEEDARLEKISTGVRSSFSTRIFSVPTAQQNEDSDMPLPFDEDPDVEIIQEMPYVCPYHYYPVDDDWQRMTCDNLGLSYVGHNGVSSGNLHVPLAPPDSIRCIRGDGNCLFRSLSYIITGSEEQHAQIRQAIVCHIRVIPHLLCEYLHIDNMEEYISSSNMEANRTWGTDVEFSLLLTCSASASTIIYHRALLMVQEDGTG